MEENKHLLDAFFALLRAGLWGTTPDPAFFVSFTETQWQALLALAQKQAVLGLIYAGVSRLPKELMPDQQLLLRLYGFSEQIRKSNAKVIAVAQEVCSWFEEAGLEPIVLKGFSVGAFYATPDLRQPGDIDLFFHRDYEKVVDIVQHRGITVELNANHDKFWYQGVLIELHSQPFRPLYPIPDLDLSPIWQETTVGRFRVLNIKANALLLLLHPAKHFMKEGLGLRQICDWAVFLKCNTGKSEISEALEEMRRQGASRFVFSLLAILVRYLGFECNETEKYAIDDCQMNRMIQLILNRGNFGFEGKHFRNSSDWCRYYWELWKYIWKSYSFWPAYFWQIMPQRVFKRFKFIIQGKAIATK